MSDILDVTFQKWMSDISKMDVRHFKNLIEWMSDISKMDVRHFGCHMSKMDVRHYASWHHHWHRYLVHAQMGDCMCTAEARARQYTTRLEWQFIKVVHQLFTIGVTTHRQDT
jgi:hypothetical protein